MQNNVVLASIFHDMAACYRYLGAEDRFRAMAYENAAKTIRNLKDDIGDYATDIRSLDALNGIGESIAEKIMEYLHTGEIKKFEQLKMQVPYELLHLLDINGIGPATLKILHDQLQVNSREELIHALETGRVKGLKGFGEKKIENMRRALKIFSDNKRMPLQDAEKIGHEILQKIKMMPGVEKAELAGSLRRKKETIGDIDIVILAGSAERRALVNRITMLPQVAKVLAKGSTKVSVLLKKNNLQVDIRLVHDHEYGAALLYFTGSKEHNIKLRTMARQKGYKINEYGLFDGVSGKRLAGTTEAEIYRFLDLKYIPPERRLDNVDMGKWVLHQNKRSAALH